MPQPWLVRRTQFLEGRSISRAATSAHPPILVRSRAGGAEEQEPHGQPTYIEWRTEKDANGNVVRVTFTTEFFEYYEALAAQSAAAVVRELSRLTGVAVPATDIFGAGFDPDAATPSGRAARVLEMAERNPWLNSDKGIAFLMHGSNTLGALFGLLAECGVRKQNIDASDVCGSVDGACVPGLARILRFVRQLRSWRVNTWASHWLIRQGFKF